MVIYWHCYKNIGGCFVMYMLRTDKITDEEDNEYEVYGVDAAEGDVSLSFPEIFFNIEDAKAFITLISDEDVSVSQIKYLIDDVICKMCSV